ncbi:CLUMA_CG021363, isoform A [Clunio marinus]|uniref:CLUMA_CG021363, isoform A n=1 Tax=Clunio marinus TaxID=568069 RepID=A0A1J1J9P3_9DIPT|nr:CLUMA_CG021363, isoform A [Clunio marinus]
MIHTHSSWKYCDTLWREDEWMGLKGTNGKGKSIIKYAVTCKQENEKYCKTDA